MKNSKNTPNLTDVEEVWDYVSVGLDSAFRREHMSSQQYMDLYSTVYNYCTKVKGGSEDSTSVSLRESRIVPGSSAEFVGMEVYQKLRVYVSKNVAGLRSSTVDLNGEGLLSFYTTEWGNFRLSSKVMDGIFSYLNRHWIKRELDDGKEGIYMIYTLALSVWKETLFTPIKDRVMDAVLELIRRERSGEFINNKYVSGVVECLVELGIDEYVPAESAIANKTSEKDKLVVYREHFETRFLETTREYYTKEVDCFLETKRTISEYMLVVEKRLEEEDKRCKLYLNSATSKPLAECCEDVLIAKRLDFFQSQFFSLLLDNRNEDLARMFKLCEKVPGGLDEMRKMLEKHIAKEGHEAIEKVACEANIDPKLYVKTLLDVHQKFQDLVRNAFHFDPGFTQSLDKAATNFVNKNAVTAKFQGSQRMNKSAELLAKYCDQLLRKSARMPDENEMEDLLNRIIVVFKYIEDKDVFLKFYTRHFSKRLITEMSSSDEAEANFINKLKNLCGYEYTAKLTKMVNDTQVSKDLVSAFKDVAVSNEKKQIEFNILVVSSGSWPTFPPMQMNLPATLSNKVEQFGTFYNEKFNGRRLTWIHSQSRGELTSLCYPKKYMFTATTAQMTVMLLFNEQDTYSMQKIVDATGIDTKSAVCVVASLIKNEILKSDKIDEENKENGNEKKKNAQSEDVPLDAMLKLNMAYANKKVRVDLSKMTMRQEVVKDQDVVQQNVDEDRKNVISACVVRIMKTRKTLAHQQLVMEVIQQLGSRFKPKVELIKRCVGNLIEKEYLRRMADQRDVYEYIS